MSSNSGTPSANSDAAEGLQRQKTADAPKTFRLCVALFNTLPATHIAANELTLKGVKSDDIYAVARDEVFTPLPCECEVKADPLFPRLTHPLQFVPSIFGVGPCLASPGKLLEEIGALTSQNDGKHAIPDWLSESQHKRLTTHLDDRGLVLIVSSATPVQQDLVCLSLLRISQRGIQSHDFTRLIQGGSA